MPRPFGRWRKGLSAQPYGMFDDVDRGICAIVSGGSELKGPWLRMFLVAAVWMC